MLTIAQVAQYLEHRIAEERLSGDREALRQTQLAAGVLLRAAEWHGDRDAALRFRTLAAEAANKQEQIENHRR
jgi:hypothetical protein